MVLVVVLGGFRGSASAVRDAEFIQESGPEREDVKLALFKEIDAAAPPHSVIASSFPTAASAMPWNPTCVARAVSRQRPCLRWTSWLTSTRPTIRS